MEQVQSSVGAEQSKREQLDGLKGRIIAARHHIPSHDLVHDGQDTSGSWCGLYTSVRLYPVIWIMYI